MNGVKSVFILAPVALVLGVLSFVWWDNREPWETLIRGTSGADVLRGSAGDERILDSYIPDKEKDYLYGGGGDDLLQAVSDPPSEDILRCGSGDDEVDADPQDKVFSDCEKVATIDLSKESPPPGVTQVPSGTR